MTFQFTFHHLVMLLLVMFQRLLSLRSAFFPSGPGSHRVNTPVQVSPFASILRVISTRRINNSLLLVNAARNSEQKNALVLKSFDASSSAAFRMKSRPDIVSHDAGVRKLMPLEWHITCHSYSAKSLVIRRCFPRLVCTSHRW